MILKHLELIRIHHDKFNYSDQTSDKLDFFIYHLLKDNHNKITKKFITRNELEIILKRKFNSYKT
jgi:hypothetical protein